MSKPTPPPWVAIGNKIFDPVNDDQMPTIAVCQASGHWRHKWPAGTPEANAAYIVKCVNMHDELIWTLGLIASCLKRNDSPNALALIEAMLTKEQAD